MRRKAFAVLGLSMLLAAAGAPSLASAHPGVRASQLINPTLTRAVVLNLPTHGPRSRPVSITKSNSTRILTPPLRTAQSAIDHSVMLEVARFKKLEMFEHSQPEIIQAVNQPKSSLTKQSQPPKPQTSQSQAPTQQTKPQSPAQQPTTITYTVKPGDQLGLIAYQYNTTVSEIMRLNNLASADMLFAGQTLTIQGAPRQIPNPYQNGAVKGGAAVAAHWDFVNVNFPIGAKATVTDIATGLSYQVVRMSGFLHADVEPVTAADTATMHRIYNNRWSWASRPVVVEVNGHRFAAAINGMPHDIQTIGGNNFPGHSCIHFLGSKNHFNQQEDANHQANVRRAVGN